VLVEVYALYSYVSVSLIIGVYSLTLAFLESAFNFKNLLRANDALSAFIILTPIA